MNAPRPDSETLALHALGLLDPEQRAAVEAALASDPALASEHAEVARHLALYEKYPAPPAPPTYASVAEAADVPRVRSFPWIPAAAAALLVALSAVMYFTPRSERRPPESFAGRGGTSLVDHGDYRAGDQLSASRILDFRLAGRAWIVLDAGAAVRFVSAEEIRLEAGRAWFGVEPGPFRVTTPVGDVAVLGTTFEVDVRDGLVVTVQDGRVRAGAFEVGEGERLAAGRVGPAGEVAGAFFRRPILSVEAPKSAEPDASVLVSLVLENPGPVRLEVPGPETVATGALLSFAGPRGRVETRGLDFAQALSGGFDPLRPVVLGPRERRVVVFRVQVPSSAGSWRLSALYRPQGEAAVASEPVSLEVR